MSLLKQLRLYLVIGPQNCATTPLISVIQQAVQGGITAIQLRDKCITDYQFEQYCIDIQSQFPNLLLVVNDRIDIAKKRRLPLHIGQTDIPIEQARNYLGPEVCIGLSIENDTQAEQYKNCSANYFGVGPIFSTHSKKDAANPIGIASLKKIRTILNHKPIVAIGGINQTNAKMVLATGVDGIAVVSAIAAAKTPMKAAANLKNSNNKLFSS